MDCGQKWTLMAVDVDVNGREWTLDNGAKKRGSLHPLAPRPYSFNLSCGHDRCKISRRTL